MLQSFKLRTGCSPLLISQQKIILIIAAAAFSCIAALFFFYRYVSNRNKKSEATDPPPVVKIPVPLKVHPEIEINSSSSIIYHLTSGKYLYISPAPPIKNLVISGGGAKGVILLGVLKAFDEHIVGCISFRDRLENIAGSSVGAITACLIAAGMSAKRIIHEATSKVNFQALLGKG